MSRNNSKKLNRSKNVPTKVVVIQEDAVRVFIPSTNSQTEITVDDAKSIVFDALLRGDMVMPAYKSKLGIHFDIFENKDMENITANALNHFGIKK